MINYSEKYIPNESQTIKEKINEIFNHPLISGDNYSWIDHRNRDFNSDGGCIDLNDNSIESSILGVSYIVNFLLKYNPKKILEIGTNSGSFSLISKLVLGDVQIYTVDREPKFKERVDQINSFFENPFIHMFIGDSTNTEFITWANQNSPYDFAWIDAKHSYENALSDINTSLSCNIKIIACDDCGPKIPTGVLPAVTTLVNENKVKIVSDSKIESWVGAITIIEKK